MVIIHSYVSLPEGTQSVLPQASRRYRKNSRTLVTLFASSSSVISSSSSSISAEPAESAGSPETSPGYLGSSAGYIYIFIHNVYIYMYIYIYICILYIYVCINIYIYIRFILIYPQLHGCLTGKNMRFWSIKFGDKPLTKPSTSASPICSVLEDLPSVTTKMTQFRRLM